MKKLLLTAFLGLLALAGFSQARWDVRAGLSLSGITDSEADMRAGYSFGVGMDYAFTDRWALQSGLMFESKGYNSSYGSVDVKAMSHYLDIPILAAVKIDLTERARFVINAGPYIGIGLGGKARIEDYEGDNPKLFTDEGLNMKRFDLGLQYGVGFELDEHYLVNFTGQYGFITPFDYGDNYEGDKSKNLAFFMTLGYRF